MIAYAPMLTMITSKLGLTQVVTEAELDMRLSSVNHNPNVGKFIAETRYWLSRWAEALEPVYQVICRNASHDPRTYLHAISLRIEYIILYIYTTVPRFSGLITAKSLTPQYREIIVYRSAQKNHDTGQWELVEEIADFTVLPDGRLDWHRQPVSESASILSGVC